MATKNPQDSLRVSERDAICRYCDEDIRKGEMMFSFYSIRGRGQYIHLCMDCMKRFKSLVLPD